MATDIYTQIQQTYLSDSKLAERYSSSRATIWRWVAQGKYPKPVKLSPGCTRWRLSDVIEWEREVA